MSNKVKVEEEHLGVADLIRVASVWVVWLFLMAWALQETVGYVWHKDLPLWLCGATMFALDKSSGLGLLMVLVVLHRSGVI